MLFNIIMFQIGEEYQRGLYKKCCESVLREFPNDNIIIFHSFEEVFERYPALKEEYFSYHAFLERINKDIFYSSDLIRLLLTKYIDNMIYLDSDIYLHRNSNFREELIKNMPEKFVFTNLAPGYNFFYSKHESKKLKEWMSRAFAGDIYYSDDIATNYYPGFYNDEVVFYNQDKKPKFTHFNGLVPLKKGIVKNFYILKDCSSLEKLNELAYDETAIFYDNKLYHNNTNWAIQNTFDFNKTLPDISINDILALMNYRYNISFYNDITDIIN